ncbi:hypothetical protein ACTTAM_05070 [Rhodobacter capsulatus]|uniref:hypothetical protein n=1 Tax=Rhodobacter capsulatus TaxID=1061 RepID=UPI004028E502
MALPGLTALETGEAFRPGDIDLMAGVELGFSRAARRADVSGRPDRRAGAAQAAARADGRGAPPPPALLDALIRDGQTLAERFT